MANVVTTLSAIPVSFMVGLGFAEIIPKVLTLDTVGSDITLYTPASTGYACIVGANYQSAAAHSITFKSGSTTLVTLPIAANSGPSKGVGLGDGLWIIGQIGEALKINFTTSLPSTALFYVAEFTEQSFSK